MKNFHANTENETIPQRIVAILIFEKNMHEQLSIVYYLNTFFSPSTPFN